MSAMVPVPAINAEHFFAGPHGHVFVVLFKPKENHTPCNWALNVQGGALALDMDDRAPVISEASAYARETWPDVGGLLIIDHRGHRA